ncbi:hypothetical protein D9611_011516 [Ephemerocybe angulata]|uniref:ATP-dependent DNA helicase n=1 Tax=Ephemerocybe angulata TaxID=980116 RepID=A0A8H5FJL9_9AGAR|nr:hypothetical protein D9611_011516 [Tulosesus angulatus]
MITYSSTSREIATPQPEPNHSTPAKTGVSQVVSSSQYSSSSPSSPFLHDNKQSTSSSACTPPCSTSAVSCSLPLAPSNGSRISSVPSPYGGGHPRLVLYTPVLDQYIISEHKAADHPGGRLKFVDYHPEKKDVPSPPSASNPSSVTIFARIPTTELGPFLTVVAARKILKHHGVQVTKCHTRDKLMEVLNSHLCRECGTFLTELCLIPSSKELKSLRNGRAYRTKIAKEDPNTCDIVQAEDTTHPFPPAPVTKELEEFIVARVCKRLVPEAFEERGSMYLKLQDAPGRRERAPRRRESIRKGSVPRYALAKGLWIGNVPPELQELRYIERILVAKVRHSICWAKVSSGMRKMKANVVSFESPMPKIYSMLPPPREDIEEVLAIMFTGPMKPTTETFSRTPFLVRRNHVGIALRWLILNHCDYANIELSEENLASYPEDVPPVVVEYVKKGTNKSAADTSVWDNDEEDGTEEVSLEAVKARALHHLNNEGRFLNIGQGEKVSIWQNPQLYPQMFPWLFPYGLGGVGSIEALKTVTTKLINGESAKPQTEMERNCWNVFYDLDCIMGKVEGSITTKKNMRAEVWSLVAACGSPSWYFTMSPADIQHPLCLYYAGTDTSYQPNLASSDVITRSEPSTTRLPTPGPEGGACTVAKQCLATEVPNSAPSTVQRDICDNASDVETAFHKLRPETGTTDRGGEALTGEDVDMEDTYDVDCHCQYCLERAAWWDYFLKRFDGVLLRSNVHSCDRNINKDGTTSVKQTYISCRDNKYKKCRARFPRPVHEETKVDRNTGALVMKKGEQWINFVTRTATALLGCNTDTTSLLSGTSVKAVIVYVTDYITKPGLKTHVMFDAIQTVISNNAELITGDLKAKERARQLMTKIINLISAKMELGAPMISLYLLGHPDHYTGHIFKPIYWRNYAIEVSRPYLLEDIDDGEDKVVLMKKDGEYCETSFVFDYIYRPAQVESLCVYEFIQRCSRTAVPKKGKKNGTLPRNTFAFQHCHPLAQTQLLHVRTEPVENIIPNFLGPPLPRSDVGDREEYALTMLSLFHPWRNGKDLRRDAQCWDDAFTTTTFQPRFVKIMNNFNLKYECLDARDDYRSQLANAPELPHNNFASLLGPNYDPEEDVHVPLDWTFNQETANMPLDEPSSLTAWEKGRLKLAFEVSSVLQGLGWDKASKGGKKFDYLAGRQRARFMPPAYWKSELLKSKQLALENILSPAPAVCAGELTTTTATISDRVFIADKKYLLRKTVPQTAEELNYLQNTIALFKLNYEQEKAFRIVANHSTDPYSERLNMYIGGMGGTGKSRVLEALKHFFALRKETYKLIVVAPMGSAAALLGGQTYHTAFGISDIVSNANPAKVLSRLVGVRYCFFDEVSMLSAIDLYRISERLSVVLNYAEQSFGGLNMIFAGDFAQLPPAVGGEAVSLYGRADGKSGDIKVQKNIIGRSLWHEVTTVVMLKQNMRQTNMSKQDTAYRRALQNMRYKACDWEDIAFLRSRITRSVEGSPSIVDPNFRDVSVITTRNAIKDVMNEVGSKRFAAESGVDLAYFYSEDEISREPGKTSRRRIKKRMLLQAIEPSLQHDLWHQPPSTVKGHIPGRLGLCIGLPILIKHNEATELGITNGQEGYVYGWQEGKGSRGQPILDVLFVELKKPPKEVQICGLPVNVVPLLPSTSTQLDCIVKGGSHVLINRTQVEVLPNFAMTDFASQGKTREFNVVDLAPCLTHQSMYTALSRGSTAEGTIILRDFSANIIMGGLRRKKQIQEFRCLELLSEITDLRYNGLLPVEVFGMYRKELIASYRKWKGDDHIPASIPQAIRWSVRDPWMDDPDPVKWRIVDTSRDKAPKLPIKDDRVLIAAQGSRTLKQGPLTTLE